MERATSKFLSELFGWMVVVRGYNRAEQPHLFYHVRHEVHVRQKVCARPVLHVDLEIGNLSVIRQRSVWQLGGGVHDTSDPQVAQPSGADCRGSAE